MYIANNATSISFAISKPMVSVCAIKTMLPARTIKEAAIAATIFKVLLLGMGQAGASRYFQVDAPSSRRTGMDRSASGSKFRALTPILLSCLGSTGSQWVTQPQERQRTNFNDLSPHMYSCVAPGVATTRTSGSL
jgi:hypothetical protein